MIYCNSFNRPHEHCVFDDGDDNDNTDDHDHDDDTDDDDQ